MKKVLIVSPHFPPVNAADMHRTRLALPFLRSQGWEATILAVTPDSVEGVVIDNLLVQTYPADIRVIRVSGLSPHYTRWAGIGSLWWRCGWALRKAGEKLLDTEKFDLVFFSTTQFDAFTLGPRWRQRYGVPYILDYQDPWVNDYYRNTKICPPGGPLKYWLSQHKARRREPDVLRSADGVIAVSTSYGHELARRYPWFRAEGMITIPFGTTSLDLEIARQHQPAQSLVPFGDGNFNHIYAGRCVSGMANALTILFRAFRRYLATHPMEAKRHRFHFIGTDYAPRPLGREWVIPAAEREAVRSYVHEHCYRVPYFEALYYLTQSDALVILGSNDVSYNASKIYPYLLAHRPIIVIAHENSQIMSAATNEGVVSCYTFNARADFEASIARVHAEWFVAGGCQRIHENRGNLLEKHGAEAMTTRLVELFDAVARTGFTRTIAQACTAPTHG